MVKEANLGNLAYQQMAKQLQDSKDPAQQVYDAYNQAGKMTGFSTPKQPAEAEHPIANTLLSGAMGAGIGALFSDDFNRGDTILAGMATGMTYGWNKSQQARNKWKKEADAVNLKLYTQMADDILTQATRNAQILNSYELDAESIGTDEYTKQKAEQLGVKLPENPRGIYNKDVLKDINATAAQGQMGGVLNNVTPEQAPNFSQLGKLNAIPVDEQRQSFNDWMGASEKKRHNIAREEDFEERTNSLIGRRQKLNQKTNLEMDRMKNPAKYGEAKAKKPENMPNYRKALSQFLQAYQEGSQEKIETGRAKFIEIFGVDPMKELDISKSGRKTGRAGL